MVLMERALSIDIWAFGNRNANSGDSNDPFPSPSNTEFTEDTMPNSNAYDGLASNVSVRNIQRAGV